MTNAPDFYARATEQLRAADGADTVVLATMNDKLMHLQTRAPRGPAELVHIARRLLEDAADQCRESGPRAVRTEDARALAVLHGAIDLALHALPDPDAEAA